FIDEWEFSEPQNGGYAAVWNIDGAGTLLEGYLLGDRFGKVVAGTCDTCGLNVDRVFDVTRIAEVEAQLGFTGMAEQKVKGARIDLAAIRKVLLGIQEIRESQIVLKDNKLTIRLALNKRIGLAKARKALASLEVTPKYEVVRFEKLIEADKLKFRPIIVET
ncbi:hypothetical protein HY642_06655, partial [Candidatus Woesearchaeota archaeon]|nr:hypothetical protein [Candidatus Woesearchaeota archaeon]